MDERDIDAQFDEIVARIGEVDPLAEHSDEVATVEQPPPTPDTDPRNPEPPDTDPRDTVPPAAPPRTVHDITAALDAAQRPEPEPQVWRESPPASDDEDHFEPPPVRLPPAEDLGYWGTVIGLVFGPLIVVWVVVAQPFYAAWWAGIGIVLFLGGFALLVLRQPRTRTPDDDADGGARV